MLTTETAIRDRFILCINEIDETLDEISNKLSCHKSYLSKLKVSETPKISSALIANLCLEYNYNAHWILTGEGAKKYKERYVKTKEEKLIEIIGDLLNALLEIKPHWNNATKQLVQESKKRVQ